MMRLRAVVLGLVVSALAVGAVGAPGGAVAGRPVGPQGATAAAYVPGSVLVRFEPGAVAADRAAARASVGATVNVRYSLVPGLERLELPTGVSVEAAVDALSRNPTVRYAEPDYVVSATDVTPNDPQYGSLWGMTNVHAPAAWGVATGAANVVVADIDTGIDLTHPDLAANKWVNPGEIAGNGVDDDGNGYVDDVNGWDFVSNDNNPADGNGHGTHTSGTIGAVGNNSTGVVGVNWSVKLMALKFLSDSGSGSTSNAVRALQYAVSEGAQVSNNSWGGGGFSQSLYDAIVAAGSAGHLFVAAAGNNGTNNDSWPYYPAAYNNANLIAVAAIDSTDAKASFSNYGATSVDLGAPGVNILSTTPGSTYGYMSGTSMATPHVTGAAAMLIGRGLTGYAAVKSRLLATARPIAALSGKTVSGGTLDLACAVSDSLCATPPPSAPSAPSAPTLNSASASGPTTVALSWSDVDNESGYYVERSTNGGAYTRVASPGAGITSYTDTGLSASTTYSYRVQAWNSGGTSAYSNSLSAATPALTMHVSAITVTVSNTFFGYRGTARVTIVDQNNLAVASATVSGSWYYNGALWTTGSGTTSSTGIATITSPRRSASSGSIFKFCVTGVTKSGGTYNSAANFATPTCGQATRP